MTRDQAVARIKRQLAFKQTLDTEIVEELQDAQIDLEQRPTKPWFLLSEQSTTLTQIGEDRVLVPPDFLEEHEEGALEFVPADTTRKPIRLVKEDWDLLKTNYADTAPGEPAAYALVGSYFRLLPVPAAIYTLRLIYFKKGLILTSNIENEWLAYFPRLLMGVAGQSIALGPIRDSIAMNVFQGWEQKATVALYTQNESRMHANRSYQMGGPV